MKMVRRMNVGDSRWRYGMVQILGFFLFLSPFLVLFFQAQYQLEKQQIASGFGFLKQEAGFEIGESLISFSADQSYGRAYIVGLLNTLYVSAIALMGSLAIAFIVGILMVFRHPLFSWPGKLFVDVMRNIPLLFLLVFLYTIFSEFLPPIQEAYHWNHWFFLDQKGFHIPWPVFHKGVTMSLPTPQGFNYEGGHSFGPEWMTLVGGLTLYTGGFMAEIVRSSIEQTPKGQWEAAMSLGLNRFKTILLVIFPQALRTLVPPMTTQMLNLIKNSSLAVAIGYPDVVSILNTSMNQTGQAIECVFLIMVTYLTVGLGVSFVMNKINQRLLNRGGL
jgi:general L-amino acid transport system permease protein